MALLIGSFGVAVCAESRNDAPTTVTGISRTYEMMTTLVEFKVVAPPEKTDAADAAIERAQREMQDYVDVINTWDPASNAARINAQAGKAPVKIDPRLMEILTRAQKVSEMSGGAFDVTFFPLGKVWNVRVPDFKIPTPEEVARARALVDYRELALDPRAGTAYLRRPGMQIELGALAKGAAVDVAIRSLRKSGFPDALVRGSGDMYCAGSKGGAPWIIAVQNPRAPRGTSLGNIALQDRAITTSGDYEKMKIVNGKRYHHILDPRLARPAEKSIGVTVVGPQTEVADALSTTILILGPQDGVEFCKRWPGYEALIVDPEMKITKTPGFPPFVNQ